jgi:nitrite reductase (NADH) small subunit
MRSQDGSRRHFRVTEFIQLATVSQIPPGTSRAFPLGRYDVAIFNIDGEFYALENTCPHQGGPLADGWIEGATVTCPWHAWSFDVRDGKMTLGDFARVTRFPVRVEQDDIYVGVEPLPDAE